MYMPLELSSLVSLLVLIDNLTLPRDEVHLQVPLSCGQVTDGTHLLARKESNQFNIAIIHSLCGEPHSVAKRL